MIGTFANPPRRLSDQKLLTMSAAELKAEAHQRGWEFGDMGARSARVRFWQLQMQFMGPPTSAETKVQNATTPAERHRAHLEEKGVDTSHLEEGEVVVQDSVSDTELEALNKMRENERKNSTPGLQPGRDNRTAEQKAAIDNNLESKRASGETGEPEKTVKEQAKTDIVEEVEHPDTKVDPARANAAGKDAEHPDASKK